MNNKIDLILIGAGGHARSCIDVIEQTNQFNIIGLIGLFEEIGKEVLGYDVLGSEMDLHKYANCAAFLGVGGIKNLVKRAELYEYIVSLGFNFPAIISPKAHVSKKASIGSGSIVMSGAIVNAGARIGCNCIINTGAIVEHDVEINNHCHISTGAILNGFVTVGARTFIGSGSVVREGVAITQSSFVKMGQIVKITQ